MGTKVDTKEMEGLHAAIAAGGATVWAVVRRDDTNTVVERLDGLLRRIRGQAGDGMAVLLEHDRMFVGDMRLIDLGSFIWWTPEFPSAFIEATSLDEKARNEKAGVRAFLSLVEENRLFGYVVADELRKKYATTRRPILIDTPEGKRPMTEEEAREFAKNGYITVAGKVYR